MIRETPLYATHREEGGRLVEFAGFMMPVQYEGIAVEHEAVRNKAGILNLLYQGESGRVEHECILDLRWCKKGGRCYRRRRSKAVDLLRVS